MYYLFVKPQETEEFGLLAIFYNKQIGNEYCDFLYKTMEGKWEIHLLSFDNDDFPGSFFLMRDIP